MQRNASILASLQIFGYEESPVTNSEAPTNSICTGNKQQPRMMACHLKETPGYPSLGRETAL